MICEHCGTPLRVSETRGRRARYCTPACKQRAYRERHRHAVPEQLRAADRWMRFRLVPRAGKTTKVPTQVNGRNAKSTDPSTWSSYSEAAASTVGAGLGFALGDGFACLDLDQCVAPDGMLSNLAQRVLTENPDAWVELSVSGTGLHVWGLMDERPGQMLPGLEIYSQGRFIALGTTYRRGGLHPLRAPELVTA
jgi:primase-polymerase (primpol)-like protein